MSPDGKSVYVTADTPGSVSVFSRDAESGDLEPVMCVSETGSDGLCADGTALAGARAWSCRPTAARCSSPRSGRWRDRLRARRRTGALTPQSCLLDKAPKGGSCTSAPLLAGAAASAITPDGKTLIVASSEEQALALFARNADTGALTPSRLSSRARTRRATTPSTRRKRTSRTRRTPRRRRPTASRRRRSTPRARSSSRPTAAASSRVSGDSLAAFRRDPASGDLTQTGCAEAELSYKSCSETRNLFEPDGIAASSDARSLYVTSTSENAVAVFAASVAIQSRVASADRRGRFSVSSPARPHA